MKAEMQNTITLVTFTEVPTVWRATDESAAPRSSRPSLERVSQRTKTAQATAKMSTSR
jgi:hypothetical protein